MAHHLLLNEDNKRLRKVTGSADDIIGFAPTLPTPLLQPSFKYFKHMTDFCFYKALTIHQLIQFRTAALPYYADRHSLTVLSGGIRPAALNAWQDYTPPQKRRKKVLHRAAAAVDYGPQPRLPACQESCRPCYHDNQVKIDLISALHLCNGERERELLPPAPPL